MEKDNEGILLKDRSSRACVSAGYRLYMSNFKRIFRASWLAALVFAVLVSVGGTMMILRPQLALIVLPVIVLIDALFATYGFSVLKQHQETGAIGWTAHWYSFNSHIFVRTLKAWLCMLVINIVISCLIGVVSVMLIRYFSLYTALGAIVLITLLTLALILPLVNTYRMFV